MSNLAALRMETESPRRTEPVERLRQIIRERSLIVGKKMRLASGTTSTFYFDMKPTTFDPEGASLIADLLLDALANDDVDYVGGLEMGAVPIAACASLRSFQIGRPIQSFFVRERVKDHGTQRLVEPALKAGERVVVVDDVTTTGASVLKAVDVVRSAGCRVGKVITVVDRLEGARAMLAGHDLALVALLAAADFDLAS